jgi:hypothetical protein
MELLLLLAGIIVVGIIMALMASMTVTTTWSITETSEGAGLGGSQAVTVTGDDVISGTYALAAATANQNIIKPLTIANIKALIILATVDCTVYVNDPSGGSPTQTITLKANNPWEWHANSGKSIGLTGTAGEITDWYVSVAGASAGTIKFRGVQDVTP